MPIKKAVVLAALAVFCMSGSYLNGAEFEVKVVQSPADLPPGFSSLAQKGDYLLSDGKCLVLLGASPRPVVVTTGNYPYGQAMGSLIGLGPQGRSVSGDLNFGTPALRIKDRTHYVNYSRLDQSPAAGAEQPISFLAAGAIADKEGKAADIRTTYLFYPGKGQIDVRSTITNTGPVPFEDLSYSLFFDAYHRYSFNPYNAEKFPHLNFRAYQKKGYHLALINLNPVEREEIRHPGKLSPGQKYEVRYILLVDSSASGLLQSVYRILDVPAVKASAAFSGFDGDWMEMIVREALTSSIFFRAVLEKPVYQEFLLPPGVYRLQANLFPAMVEELVEVKADGENSFSIQSPPLGEISIRLKDSQGNPVPGKVSFLGISPTKSPYFRPDNPVETGKSWEGFKNSCFPGDEGLAVRLPVGTYLAAASRGPEYSVDHRVIEVLKESNPELVLVIDRVVETPGLVAFDPHLHTNKSDGQPSIPERIRSVVAEGLEVMSATDHNYVTDYTPSLDDLGLADKLTVIPGCEVTTPDVIHFNTYPMELRPGELGDGAINAIAEMASPLFAASRQKNPGIVLQVNHPRAGDLGYFNNLQLDLDSAATARPELDLNFDLLEVLNGPYFYSSNQAAIEDWFHLLNRGYYYPIVGSSDSHGIDRGEPGYSRTYVSVPDEKGKPLDAATLMAALGKGRSFVTNGPMIALKVNSLETPGGLVQAKEGRTNISLHVWGAPWVDVDEVRLVLNGERRIIFPVQAKEGSIDKLTQEIGVTLTRDTYVCVEALGRKTLFPVLQRPSESGLLEDGTLPYALTNPVFVDVDGNGRFDPPLTEKVLLKAVPGGPYKKVSRN
jgi:hypothetical protein